MLGRTVNIDMPGATLHALTLTLITISFAAPSSCSQQLLLKMIRIYEMAELIVPRTDRRQEGKLTPTPAGRKGGGGGGQEGQLIPTLAGRKGGGGWREDRKGN